MEASADQCAPAFPVLGNEARAHEFILFKAARPGRAIILIDDALWLAPSRRLARRNFLCVRGFTARDLIAADILRRPALSPPICEWRALRAFRPGSNPAPLRPGKNLFKFGAGFVICKTRFAKSVPHPCRKCF
jgi:hypothetical protein